MANAKEQTPAETRQPGLFSLEQLPPAPQLIAAAKAYAHTGTTASKDEERAEMVLSYYLVTGSLRATARHFQTSPNTIKAVLDIFATSGKLDALKQRISTKLGTVIELATDLLTEKLMLDGSVPANVLPIVIGVAVDKKALMDGEATSRVEEKISAPAQFDDLAAYLRERGIAAPAIDVESTAKPQEPQ
jgi:hypothetical protein